MFGDLCGQQILIGDNFPLNLPPEQGTPILGSMVPTSSTTGRKFQARSSAKSSGDERIYPGHKIPRAKVIRCLFQVGHHALKAS